MAMKSPRIPGAQAADDGADDLLDLPDGGALPPADPVLAELASMRAELARLKRGQQGMGEAQKPQPRALDAGSQDEAKAMAEREVAAGLRPRALLTPDGWYVHPEASRGPGSLGNRQAV